MCMSDMSSMIATSGHMGESEWGMEKGMKDKGSHGVLDSKIKVKLRVCQSVSHMEIQLRPVYA